MDSQFQIAKDYIYTNANVIKNVNIGGKEHELNIQYKYKTILQMSPVSQVSRTSTRVKNTGSSTTTGCGWSPAILALSWKTSWDATSRPSTPTCSRRMTRTSWLNWTMKPARSKPSLSSYHASWRSACWCWSTPSFSSRGRVRHDTYCTVNAPCRSGCESDSHKTQWCKHPKLADFGSRPASRSRRTARAFALIPLSRRWGALSFPPTQNPLLFSHWPRCTRCRTWGIAKIPRCIATSSATVRRGKRWLLYL